VQTSENDAVPRLAQPVQQIGHVALGQLHRRWIEGQDRQPQRPPPGRRPPRSATRSFAEILCKGRIWENHPTSGHGGKKKISSGFAGRWQNISVPANAPSFKHTKPRRQPADFRN
jgi:hypothetical protein